MSHCEPMTHLSNSSRLMAQIKKNEEKTEFLLNERYKKLTGEENHVLPK